MALAKHGITTNTPTELMFKAGVVYKNLEFSGSEWSGTVLGATSGGSKFSLVEEFADAEVDGAFVKTKGFKVKISETGTLEANLTEFKEGIIKEALHLVEDSTAAATGYKCYTTKGAIGDDDYLENIAFVGELTGGKQIIFILPNAFCTSGLEIEPSDKEQATYTLVFEAHADISGDLDHLPVKIYYPQAN